MCRGIAPKGKRCSQTYLITPFSETKVISLLLIYRKELQRSRDHEPFVIQPLAAPRLPRTQAEKPYPPRHSHTGGLHVELVEKEIA